MPLLFPDFQAVNNHFQLDVWLQKYASFIPFSGKPQHSSHCLSTIFPLRIIFQILTRYYYFYYIDYVLKYVSELLIVWTSILTCVLWIPKQRFSECGSLLTASAFPKDNLECKFLVLSIDQLRIWNSGGEAQQSVFKQTFQVVLMHVYFEEPWK